MPPRGAVALELERAAQGEPGADEVVDPLEEAQNAVLGVQEQMVLQYIKQLTRNSAGQVVDLCLERGLAQNHHEDISRLVEAGYLQYDRNTVRERVWGEQELQEVTYQVTCRIYLTLKGVNYALEQEQDLPTTITNWAGEGRFSGRG